MASNLAIVGSNLGRLAESLILYTSSEFGFVELADEFASISSIMPQKKNPVSLEIVEAFGARSAGHLASMLGILKSSTLGMSRETGYCDGELAAMVSDMTWALKITTGAVASLRVFSGRALRALIEGQSTTTELADMLVRKHGLSFRQAHNVVGKVVATVVEQRAADRRITAQLVNEAAAELLGVQLALTEGEVSGALDPRLNVEVRATRGGPAPAEVLRTVEDRRKQAEEAHTRYERRLGGCARQTASFARGHPPWQHRKDRENVLVGYGKGYPRALANRAVARVKGVLCPVIGSVMLNHLTLDVPEVAEVSAGDEVELVGASREGGEGGNSIEALATAADTVVDVMCLVGQCLPHVYLRGGCLISIRRGRSG